MDVRKELINKYFMDISLSGDCVDLYYVRKSILHFIVQNIKEFKGGLLDVGCGIMPYKEFLLNQSEEIESYTGMDFEDALHPEYALGKPDIFWNGYHIPMEDNSVDTILATEFFEHSPEPEIVMSEMLRVLKSGGTIIFTVPFLWNLHLVPHDEYRYTPFALKRHLTNAGFSNIQLSALGGWDASLAQMIGIWLQRRPMGKVKKKILSYFLIPIMRKLIKKDLVFDKNKMFGEGNMITGIGGIAFKN